MVVTKCMETMQMERKIGGIKTWGSGKLDEYGWTDVCTADLSRLSMTEIRLMLRDIARRGSEERMRCLDTRAAKVRCIV